MTPVLEVLTDREEEVLARVAAGKGRREIADELGIRPWTVKAHQANIRRKLSAATLAHAVSVYAERKARRGVTQYLTLADVAQQLQASTRTVRRAVKAGRLRPALYIGRSPRFTEREVTAYTSWLASRSRAA